MRPWFDVPVLEGSLVRLEPLTVRHAEDLAAAAEEDRGSYDLTLRLASQLPGQKPT